MAAATRLTSSPRSSMPRSARRCLRRDCISLPTDDRIDEEGLTGGKMAEGVRIRDTVRRPLRPWSGSVHKLLKRLEANGFKAAPQFLGIDEQNREILSFVPGEIGGHPLISAAMSENSLIVVARMIRKLHVATE